jgi:hypothetical protein
MPETHLEIPATQRVPGLLKTGFWICCVIAVAVVIRRLVALYLPPAAAAAPGSSFPNLDLVFAGHARLTLAHIIPALLFVLATPFVVLAGRRARTRIERVYFPLGLIVGLTAYAMSVYSIGGWSERSAVLVFNTLFLYSLVRAWRFQSAGDEREERVWLLRAIAVLLGIATTRPVMGVFFATSRITHLQPDQFFGIAFWIGFSINVALFEWWVRWSGRPKAQPKAA